MRRTVMSKPSVPLGDPTTPGRDLRLEAMSLERLLSDAAVSISALIVEDAEVVARETRWVELESSDLESLFWQWVDQVIQVLEEEDILFARAEVQIHSAPGRSPKLKAKLLGEPYDPQWHARRREIGTRDPGGSSLARRPDRRWEALIRFLPPPSSALSD